jgi:hypothetical protein
VVATQNSSLRAAPRSSVVVTVYSMTRTVIGAPSLLRGGRSLDN